MATLKRIPCSECGKAFKTESGLRWHLFHIHQWKDARELLREPSSAELAKIAYMDELELATFAKGADLSVEHLKQLIQKRFS